MKTPIVYYGGKSSLVHRILPMIPPHDLYSEVFFGGGAVFFSKAPVFNEIINDRLDIVVDFYRTLKSNFKKLKDKIECTIVSRTIHREALSILNSNNKSKLDRAWAFWYLCNLSFYNKIGGGMKYSADTSISPAKMLKSKKLLFTELLVERIENAVIENEDAIKCISKCNKSNAFHYIDPPYFNADQGHYKGYTEKDFIDLLDFLSAKMKGRFILSNYPSEILSEYISINHWNYLSVKSKLADERKGRVDKTELLVYNYKLENTLF